LYINKDKKIQQFVQRRRPGTQHAWWTENVYGIIGLAKALEICYRDMK